MPALLPSVFCLFVYKITSCSKQKREIRHIFACLPSSRSCCLPDSPCWAGLCMLQMLQTLPALAGALAGGQSTLLRAMHSTCSLPAHAQLLARINEVGGHALGCRGLCSRGQLCELKKITVGGQVSVHYTTVPPGHGFRGRCPLPSSPAIKYNACLSFPPAAPLCCMRCFMTAYLHCISTVLPTHACVLSDTAQQCCCMLCFRSLSQRPTTTAPCWPTASIMWVVWIVSLFVPQYLFPFLYHLSKIYA